MLTASGPPNASDHAVSAASDCVVLNLTEALALQQEVLAAGISVQLEEDMDWIVACIFGNLLYMISLPTNIINLVVFYKLGLRERINLCLFSLSLADLVFMTTSFVLYIDRAPRLVLGLSRFGSPVFQFMLNNHLTTLYGCSRVSAFISTLIACERCFCVVSPLKAKRLLSTRTMFWVIVVGSTLILIVEYISDLRGSVVCVHNPLFNTTSMELYPGPIFLKHRQLIETLESVVFGFFMPVCFFLLSIVATVVTVMKLKQTAVWRGKAVATEALSRSYASETEFSDCPVSVVETLYMKHDPCSTGDLETLKPLCVHPEQTANPCSNPSSEDSPGPVPSTSATTSPTKGTSLSSRSAALTRMLIANNILFIVCMSPYFGLNAIMPFLPQLSANQTLFSFMVSVYELGGYINATFNFFIYYTMGTRYRQTLRKLCRRCQFQRTCR